VYNDEPDTLTTLNDSSRVMIESRDHLTQSLEKELEGREWIPNPRVLSKVLNTRANTNHSLPKDFLDELNYPNKTAIDLMKIYNR
jgi:hypothetical protein